MLAAVILIAALFAGCGGDDAGEPETQQEQTRTTEEDTTVEEDTGGSEAGFTPAELAEFDGKDGNPAYVAVDGIVYDITGNTYWPGGDHSVCNLDAAAGKDLSDIMDQSPPRMRALIEDQPVVGTLEQ
jgi:predicted heme/steroid binding protein